jgi:hypothetical protein
LIICFMSHESLSLIHVLRWLFDGKVLQIIGLCLAFWNCLWALLGIIILPHQLWLRTLGFAPLILVTDKQWIQRP